jgi:hypothetical protein
MKMYPNDALISGVLCVIQEVLKKTSEHCTLSQIIEARRSAIRFFASEWNVEESTVRDHCTRGLHIKTSEFDQLLFELKTKKSRELGTCQ